MRVTLNYRNKFVYIGRCLAYQHKTGSNRSKYKQKRENMSTTPLPSIPTLCYLCQTDNTPHDQQGQELRVNCEKCHRPYCNKHASLLEATCCNACLNDFQVIKKEDWYLGSITTFKINPTNGRIERDEDGLPVKIEKPFKTKYKQIMLSGNDWLFSEIHMSELTEDQCEVKLEWHKLHVSYLEMLIDQHRVTRAHRLAKVRVPVQVRTEKKEKDKRQKSMEMLAKSLSSLSKTELASLMAQLQNSVNGVKL